VAFNQFETTHFYTSRTYEGLVFPVLVGYGCTERYRGDFIMFEGPFIQMMSLKVIFKTRIKHNDSLPM
jgi:hypothetical protein